MKKLVVVADDFGLCESVNDGILESYENGIVTELSLMLGSPGTDAAVEKVRTNNIYIDSVGLHCLLTFWKDNGVTTNREAYRKLFAEKSQEEIAELFYKEAKFFEQIIGRKPSHVTSQYGIHGHPKLLPTVLKWCSENDVPVRIPHPPLLGGNDSIQDNAVSVVKRVRAAGCITTDGVSGYMLGEYDDIERSIIEEISRIQTGMSTEILFHPGYESAQLAKLSSMVTERTRDVALSKSKKIKRALDENNVQLSKYRGVGIRET